MITRLQKPVFMLLALMLVTGAGFAQNSKLISADKYMQDGDLQRASEALDAAKEHPKTSLIPKTYAYEARLFLLIAQDTTGKYSAMSDSPLMDARASLDKMTEVDPDLKKSKTYMSVYGQPLSGQLFNEALTAYNAKEYLRASKYFRGSYDIYSSLMKYELVTAVDTSTLYYAAITAMNGGDNENAEKMYKELIEMDYYNPSMYQNLGQLYLDTDRKAKAEEVFAMGRTRFPKSQELLIAELNYYLSEGRATEAIDKFQLAIDNDPENADLHFAMGTAYQNMVQLDEENAAAHRKSARDAYEKTIELDPSSFDANLNLGALFYNEGVIFQDKLDEVDINDMAKAKELEEQRDAMFGESLPYFERCAEIYEETSEEERVPAVYAVEVYRSLSQIYVRQKMYDESKEAKARMEEIKATIPATEE